MLSEERRCCLRRGDVVTEKEMLSRRRRCCHGEGDVVGGVVVGQFMRSMLS
jgi:hypothetical protein